MKFVYLFVLCIIYTLPWTSNSSPAHYSGQHAHDAGHILDQSHGKKGFGHGKPGHPRSHASSASGPSVEKYSRRQQKTGFGSRHDQNVAAHAMLSHPTVQAAMRKLNQYNPNNPQHDHIRQVVKLSKSELRMQHLTAGKFIHGTRNSSHPVGGATMVLQHHRGQEQNPSHPVHVQTFYPH